MDKKIIHIDCDCFFVAVEVRDNPAIKNQAVAVGGSANARGVLATCNYAARKFGLHSAMPSAEALKRCPELLLLPPRFDVYKNVSQQVVAILKQYSDCIEPVSLDEAYLDVSDCENAVEIAREIRENIAKNIGITASAGISVNKFLAKIASDWRKPDNQFAIKPHQIAQFLTILPIKKIPGVGKATMLKMDKLQIKYCVDLQRFSLEQLVHEFGVFGHRLYGFARGIDSREVQSSRLRKSLSVEQTFARDLVRYSDIQAQLLLLVQRLKQRWRVYQATYQIDRIGIKIRFSDFSVQTAEHKAYAISSDVLFYRLQQLLARKNLAVRLLGIVITLQEKRAEQLCFEW